MVVETVGSCFFFFFLVLNVDGGFEFLLVVGGGSIRCVV